MTQPDLFTFTDNLPNVTGAQRPKFTGSDYQAERDCKRLTGQIERVFSLMRDEKWRTLSEIERETGDPQASVSAQLRHLRKSCWGGHTVNKRHRGEASHGLYEYQLIVNISSIE